MAEVQKTTQAGEMTQVFIEFVMMHAQNAALFLGQIPNPRGGEVEVNLPLAKMFIDQLAVIREKTRNNLSPDEIKVIDGAVSQLQLAFVDVAQMIKAQNLGAEVPEPLFMGEDFASNPEPDPLTPMAEATPTATVPPAPAPTPAPAPAVATEPEEGRKRFTKSYGS